MEYVDSGMWKVNDKVCCNNQHHDSEIYTNLYRTSMSLLFSYWNLQKKLDRKPSTTYTIY